MEPLPLFEVWFALHVALQFVGAFGHPWHRFAHSILLRWMVGK
jgi:hypothetical protein